MVKTVTSSNWLTGHSINTANDLLWTSWLGDGKDYVSGTEDGTSVRESSMLTSTAADSDQVHCSVSILLAAFRQSFSEPQHTHEQHGVTHRWRFSRIDAQQRSQRQSATAGIYRRPWC